MSLWPFHHRRKRRNIAAVPQTIQGIQLSSAAAGLAIPIVYGQARVPGNLIHVKPRDTTIPGGSSAADLVDTLPIAMALCEGPIRGLGAAWIDKETYDATQVVALFASGVYMILFTGTSSQVPWAYLTSNYPAEAIPYQLTAYIVNRYWPSVKGASGASFANWAWEVLGLLPQGGGILDSNPKDVINDFLTDPNHGTLFPSSLIDSSALTQLATYCQAAGIFISPVVATQRPAAEHLQEWLAAANSAFVWSDGKLKIISYGDQAITGNGTTFTPNVTPLYNLIDDDFIADGQDPVRVSRRPQSDVYNMVQVEFDNRAKGYNGDLAEAKDQASIELYTLKPAPVIKAPFIKEMAVARLVAQLALQRQVYIRNTYEFTLPFRYVLLEPMDLVTLTDSNLGLNATTVRLTEVSEEDDGSFTCVAEEWPFGVATAAAYPISGSSGYVPNVPKAPDAPSMSMSFDGSGQAYLNIVGDSSTVKHIYVLRTDRFPTLAETRVGTTSNFQSPSGIATGVFVKAGATVYVGVLAYNVNGVESPLATGAVARQGGAFHSAYSSGHGAQETEEWRVRGHGGGYGVPGQRFNSEPVYDDTGSLNLIDPIQRMVGPSLRAIDGEAGIESQRAATRKGAQAAGSGAAGIVLEEAVRSGMGGYSVPSKRYIVTPTYDPSGSILLFDPTTKELQAAAGLATGFKTKADLAVKNAGATASFGINRHNDEQSGKDAGATKSFGFAFDHVPQMRALPQSIMIFRAASSAADQSIDVRATNVSVSTYDTRAKLITGQTSSAQTENPAATLNGTPVSSVAISSSGAAAYWNLANANSTLTTYYAHFDVNTTNMDSSDILYVDLYRNDGTASTNWTLVGSKMYSAGATLTDQQISFAAALALNWDLRIVITYLIGGLLATVTVKACTYDKITPGTEFDATAGGGASVLFQAMEAP